MDLQKKKALIEWVNSVGVGPCIESLQQLKDGSILCKLVHLIDTDVDIVDDAPEEEKLGKATSFLEDRFKCSLSDKINIDTVLSGHEFEAAKLCLLVMGASLMSGNNELFVERAQKLEPILQFEIKEMVEWLLPLHEHNSTETGLNCSFFQVLSRSLHLTEEQMAHPQMSSTPHCTPGAVNNDINTPPNNFNTTPGRVFKGTPLMFSNSIQNANNSILGRFMSPKHVGGAPMMPMSPIQQLVHSPGMANKIMMQQKEMQIRRLQRELNAEKHMKMEAEGEIVENKRSLEKKEQQITSLQKQLNKYRRQTLTLQEDVDRMEGVNEKNQNLEQEIMRKKCIMTENREMKERFAHLEKDNAQLYAEVESLQTKLSQLQRYRANSEDLQMTCEDLKMSYGELQQMNGEKEDQLAKLKEENEVLRLDLLKLKEDYHTKCEELRFKKEPSLSDVGGENMGEVMETRYQEEMEQLHNEFESQAFQVKNLQEQLTTAQNQNESLSNELATTKTQCDQLQFDLSASNYKVEEMVQEIHRKQEQFAIGEQQYCTVQNQCSKLEEELSASKQCSTELETQLDSTKQDCCRLAQSLKNEKDLTSTMEGKIQKLEGIREKLNTEIENRQSEKLELVQQIECMEQEKSEACNNFTTAMGECETVKEEVLKWKQAWGELSEKLENNGKILQEKQTSLNSVEEKCRILETDLVEIKSELSENESQCTMWQNMARGFETQSKELDQKLKIGNEISEQKQTNLESELQDSRRLVENYQTELQNNKSEIEKFQARTEKQNSESHEREQKLNGDLECATRRGDELETSNKAWEAKCQQQEAVLQQIHQSGSNLEQELQRLQMDNKKYEQQITEGNCTVDKLQKSIEGLEKSMKEGQELVASRDKEIVECKSLFQNKQSQYDTLCQQVESITQSHTKLEESMNDEIKSRAAELECVKTEFLVETEKCHDLQSRINEKDAQLREMEQDVYIWQDKYAQLDGTHFTLQQQVKKLEENFSNAETEKANLLEQISQSQKDIDIYKEQVSNLEKDVNVVNEQKEKLQKENTMLTDEKFSLSNEGKGLESFVENLKHSKESLESELEKVKKDHKDIVEKLNIEKRNAETALKNELQNYKVDFENTKSELSCKINELEELKNVSIDKDSKITSLEQQYASSEESINREQLTFKNISEENQLLISQVVRLNETLEQNSQQSDVLKKHVEELKKENENLSEKLKEFESSITEEQNKRENSHAAVLSAETALSEMKTQLQSLQSECEKKASDNGKEKSNYLDKIKSLEMSIIEGQQALHETEEQCRQDLDMYESRFNDSDQKVCEQKQAIVHLNEELCNAQKELRTRQTEFDKKYNSLHEEHVKLQSLCTALEGDLTTSEILNGELKTQVETIEAKQNQLKYDCDSIRAEKLCTEQSMKSWQEKARDNQMKRAEAEEQVYLSKEATEHKMVELENEIKQVRERNGKLQNFVDSITSKMSLVEIELYEKQQSYENDQKIIGELQSNNKSLLAENDMYKEKIQSAESKQSSLKKELDTYKQKMTATENHVESYFQKVCLLDEALKNKNSEKEKYQKEVSELKQSLDNATNKVENMEEEFRREKQKYANLENEYSDAESVNACLEEKIEELESKMHQVESALNTTQVEKTTVEESFKVELHSAHNKQQELESDLEEAQSAVEEFRKELVGLQGQLEKMDSDLISSRNKNEDLSTKVSSVEKEKVSLKQDLEEEKKRSDYFQKELEKWNSKWNDVENFVGSQQDRASNMEDKLTMSRKEVESLEKKLSAAEVRSANLEEELKVTKGKVEEVKDNTLVEVKEARKAENDAEAALEDVQAKYGQLEEQYETIHKKYSEAKQHFGKLHERYQNADKECSKHKNNFEELRNKYEMLKGATQKFKDRLGESEKRENQYTEVINKYKAQQEIKNADISKLNKELAEEIEKKLRFEQKCQELDVEVTAVKQQSREQDSIHKKLSSEKRSLETQLDYANRELRGKPDMSRRVLSARELPTTAHLVMKKDSTSESEMDRSIEMTPYHLRSGRSPRASLIRKQPKSPSLTNLRKAPSTFSLASSTRSDYPNEDNLLLSPTSSMHSQDSIDSHGVLRQSRRLTEFARSTTTFSGFDPTRSADVPRGLGALLSSEDEPEHLEFGRLSELQRRNTLCLPHMKSSYPVETQVRATQEMNDKTLKMGSTLEQAIEEFGMDDGTSDKRRLRKRTSVDRHSFNDHEGAAKKKAREDDDDGVYTLNTPGVKLYKRYSPRLASIRKVTPSSRRFDTTRLHAALEEVSGSPVSRTRKSTPKKTPSSMRKLRNSLRSYSAKEISSDENNKVKTRSLRESLSFNIGFTPVKNSKNKLKGLISGKKESQMKKKPLGDNNYVTGGI